MGNIQTKTLKQNNEKIIYCQNKYNLKNRKF